MRIARLAPLALLIAAAAACGSDKKNNNTTGNGNLTATQRTELSSKISILGQSQALGPSVGAFAGLFAPAVAAGGSTKGVTVSTDLTAAAQRAITDAVNARRDLPLLQTVGDHAYQAIGILFQFQNSQSNFTDLSGVLLLDGFPITKMIVALQTTGSDIASGVALAALAKFTGTCTSASNCTVSSWVGTTGTVNVSAAGASGGACPNSAGPVTCNLQNFNASFNFTAEDNPGSPTSTHTASMSNTLIPGVKITVNCANFGC